MRRLRRCPPRKCLYPTCGVMADELDVNSRWDVMQMQIVDNLGSLVVSAGNAAISTVSLRPQVIEGGLSATSAPAPTSAPNGVNSQVNAAALTDPGLMQVSTALTVANAIEHLAFGGPDGKPDWTTIRGKDDVRNSVASSLPILYTTSLLAQERWRVCQGFTRKPQEPTGFVETNLNLPCDPPRSRIEDYQQHHPHQSICRSVGRCPRKLEAADLSTGFRPPAACHDKKPALTTDWNPSHRTRGGTGPVFTQF